MARDRTAHRAALRARQDRRPAARRRAALRRDRRRRSAPSSRRARRTTSSHRPAAAGDEPTRTPTPRSCRRVAGEGVLVTRRRAGAVADRAGLHRPGRGGTDPPWLPRARARGTYGAGRIRPHERTHPGPSEDRLRLTRATQANLSPIFSLFSDPGGAAQRALAPGDLGAVALGRARPMTTAPSTGCGASTTRRRSTRRPDALRGAELLIADGHHRYETARVYADEIGGEGAHRYVLMCLVALQDPGLTVFPTHRLVRGSSSAQQESLANTLIERTSMSSRSTTRPSSRRSRTATRSASATSTPTSAGRTG